MLFTIAHIVALICAVALFMLSQSDTRESSNNFKLTALAMLVLCVAEVVGFTNRSGDPTWYLSSFKDFLLGIVYMAVFYAVLFIQYRTFDRLLNACEYRGGFTANYLVGVGGVALAAVVWIVCSFTETNEYIAGGAVLAISQVAQIILTLVACGTSGGKMQYGLLWCAFYLVGVVAIAISLLQLILMFIVAILTGIGASYAVTKGAGDTLMPGGRSGSSIQGPYGGTLHGDRVDRDTFRANGTTYKREHEGFSEVWREQD